MPGGDSARKVKKLLKSINRRSDLAVRHLTDGGITAAAYILGTITADTGHEVGWQHDSDTGADTSD
jgi:hypothetical protein